MSDDTARARQEIALLLRRLTVELDAVGQRFAIRHGLNRTDVRALVAIMDDARRGEALTAGRGHRARPQTMIIVRRPWSPGG